MLSKGQLVSRGTSWTLEEWKTEPSKLSRPELFSTIPLATPEQDPVQWKGKIEALINGIADLHVLEAVGSSLSAIQAQAVIEGVLDLKIVLREKLIPIFVGMPSSVFRTLLSNCTDQQLLLLQQESMSEALQHHLTLLAKELSGEIKAWTTSLALLAREIADLPVGEHEAADVDKTQFVIDSFHAAGQQLFRLINRSLALAWNTNRGDLIDQLSVLKEQSQKSLSLYFEPIASEGKELDLREALEKKLNAVFNCQGDDGTQQEMENAAPAIEALACFSLWYVKDYWELGLLPEIKSVDQLELSKEKYVDKERLHHREKLFQTAAENLQRLGLNTVCDLKKACIYSKTSLQRFIAAHQKNL